MSDILQSFLSVETITAFGRNLSGACYPAPLHNCQSTAEAIVKLNDIISQKNRNNSDDALITLTLTIDSVVWLPAIARELSLTTANVNFAINYHLLSRHYKRLLSLSDQLPFWLYDFAEPGTDWERVRAFPLTGVVLDPLFFEDNFRKFSFPYLLEHFREQQAEVILRSPDLPLSEKACAALNLTGWQHQLNPHLFPIN